MLLAWGQRQDGLPQLLHRRCVVADDLLVVLGYPSGRSDKLRVVLLDPRDCSWRSLPCEEDIGGRFCAAAVRHEVFVFHGGDRSALRVHCLNTKTLQWRLVETSGERLILLGRKCACAMDDRIFLFAKDYRGARTGGISTFALDKDTGAWELVSEGAGFLPSYFRSATVGSIVYYLDWDCSLSYWDSASGESGTRAPYDNDDFRIFCPMLLAHGRRLYTLDAHRSVTDYGSDRALRYELDGGEWSSVSVGGFPPSFTSVDCAAVVGDRAFLFTGAMVEGAVRVLELAPGLRTLCLLAARFYDLDGSNLPPTLRRELQALPDPAPL